MKHFIDIKIINTTHHAFNTCFTIIPDKVWEYNRKSAWRYEIKWFVIISNVFNTSHLYKIIILNDIIPSCDLDPNKQHKMMDGLTNERWWIHSSLLMFLLKLTLAHYESINFLVYNNRLSKIRFWFVLLLQ